MKWPARIDVITLFVTDVSRAKSFYATVFELDTVYEDANSAVVRFENLTVNLLDETHAAELVEPAAVARAGAGSRFQFTIEVADLDAACAELAARGVTLLNGPMQRPWGIRTAAVADPDGYVWEFAQG